MEPERQTRSLQFETGVGMTRESVIASPNRPPPNILRVGGQFFLKPSLAPKQPTVLRTERKEIKIRIPKEVAFIGCRMVLWL